MEYMEIAGIISMLLVSLIGWAVPIATLILVILMYRKVRKIESAVVTGQIINNK
ncbi:MAG: hypothetical protein PHO00_05965 [bacterium]|nr:hypothetical protein [bacterium]